MSVDTIEILHGSLIQHGPHSDRIYVMHLNTTDVPGLLSALDILARQRGYGKIFAKTPAKAWPVFKSAGYIEEALVPGFFNGRTDGYFLAKFFSAERQTVGPAEKRLQGVFAAGKGLADAAGRTIPADVNVVPARPSDAVEMSTVYRQVFQSYPFPIHDPAYLNDMIREGGRYFCIRMAGRIVAVAAAEMDVSAQNAEMTDFATLSEWRGQGLAGALLRHMDRKVRASGIRTAYTITRVASRGMNAVFENNGYRYAGYLKNNSQIGGHIESMVVWYKRLEGK